MKVKVEKELKEKIETKRKNVSQTEFPQLSLEKALRIARAIWEYYAGQPTPPHDVAIAIDMAPTSGTWRNLCGTSIAYGLTEGGYGASKIELTSLGRKLVAPTEEGEDLKARIEAILNPNIMSKFFLKYNKAKFPPNNIAENVLVSLGLPKERGKPAVEILLESGKYAGILKATKTGIFVALDSNISLHGTTSLLTNDTEISADKEIIDVIGKKQHAELEVETKTACLIKNNRVFISHGKNKQFVNHLKELLIFGKFEPVVSVEKESTAIPVPEKVFEDMRSCSSGVIHVMNEGDPPKINENVLIEIGAAMALYKKNVVLLVQKGVSLPSNLQGLYRCDYEGEKLDYEATMKLLKIFNQLQQ